MPTIVPGRLILWEPWYITAESTVATALFLNTVPLEESILSTVASRPFAPERQVAALSLVLPSAYVVTVFCHMYFPSSQGGAVADQPGAVEADEDNAYSTVTEATEVCFSSSMSSFMACTLKLMPLLEDRSSCSPKLAATWEVVMVPAFILLPSIRWDKWMWGMSSFLR